MKKCAYLFALVAVLALTSCTTYLYNWGQDSSKADITITDLKLNQDYKIVGTVEGTGSAKLSGFAFWWKVSDDAGNTKYWISPIQIWTRGEENVLEWAAVSLAKERAVKKIPGTDMLIQPQITWRYRGGVFSSEITVVYKAKAIQLLNR